MFSTIFLYFSIDTKIKWLSLILGFADEYTNWFPFFFQLNVGYMFITPIIEEGENTHSYIENKELLFQSS